MKKVCCQLSPDSHTQERGDPNTKLVRVQNESQVAKLQNERIRILLQRQEEQILADSRGEIHKHELQADSDRRGIQELSGIISLNEEKLITLLHVMNNFDEIKNFFMNNYQNKNRDLREAHMKSLNEMERLQGSTVDTIARKRLVEDQETILELTGKIQELQNEVNCMNDSKDFPGC